jgi:natural product biosynthesis luciferase-like monooxygenase protein
MDFGIMFFSSVSSPASSNAYRTLLESAKFADEHGFCCIWTPERHFHQFGGLFPNPSVISAALAMITQKLQIRSGSLISPLHDSIRIAEDWAVVDNLSGGRVAISFGSGWNADDFVLAPDDYTQRQAVMYQQIETVRHLWRGGSIVQKNGRLKDTSICIYPRPVQPELPIWVTSSGNEETFIRAGAIGANILTHLIGQDMEALAEKIQKYRASLARHNFNPDHGKVTLMLHTYMGNDIDMVRAKVRAPFREYLRSAISLEQKAAIGGGSISGGHRIEPHSISEDAMEDLLDRAFDRYFDTASLLGTPASCKPLIWQLEQIAVNEVACLIDFIDDHQAVMESLEYVDTFRTSICGDALRTSVHVYMDSFLEDLESEV